ncbi:MAG: hypothetical protein ACYTHJ_21540 [Planctomycetota bacterium]|jgi:hypothetical protein
MEFDAVLIPPRRSQMMERGFWHEKTVNDDLDACVSASPAKTAVVARRTASSGRASQGMVSNYVWTDLTNGTGAALAQGATAKGNAARRHQHAFGGG